MIDSSAAPEPERGVAHRVRRAELLADLHHALSGAVQDDESLLHVVAERVATLTGQGCSVRLLGEDGRTLGEAAFHHPDAATRDAMRGLLAPVQRPELSLASSLVGHAPRTYALEQLAGAISEAQLGMLREIGVNPYENYAQDRHRRQVILPI